MLKLYESPLSGYVQKVKIALLEKGIEFEALPADGLMAGTAGGAFVEANPRAEVPALIDGEFRVFDSTVILEYIEDKWPNPPLLPKSPAERARVRMIEDVMDTQYEPNNWGAMEVTRFQRASGALAEEMVAYGKKNIEGYQAWLDRQLGSRPWFNGDQFGWGDVCVVPFLNRSAMYGHLPPKDSRLAAWLVRVNQRPSVDKVRKQVEDVVAKLPDLADMLKKGQIKRQYRDHRLEWMLAAGGLPVVLEGIENGTIRFSRDIR